MSSTFARRPHRVVISMTALITGCLLAITPVTHAAESNTHDAPAPDLINELFDLPFDQLMDIQVMSVTRTAGQDWFTAPAAIYVLSSEDIQRSGHQSMPELLRMVPGLHVAQIDANTWAISSRGFNNRFNPYQLVQMDGRTLYTPVFAGTIWEMHDTVLQDLANVEVIRGPGGSLWGANAVNGIINFTTKDAQNTQGWLVDVGVGSELKTLTTARYGGRIEGENTFFRVYGKTVTHDDYRRTMVDYTDDYHRQQGGFRIDWRDDPSNTLTLQGDVTQGHYGTTVKNPDVPAGTIPDIDGNEKYNGWNILGRWNSHLGPDENTQIQMYYDQSEGVFPSAEGTAIKTGQFDVDFQHDFKPVDDHGIVWGLGYRHIDFEPTDGNLVAFRGNRQDDIFSTFVQDTITLEPDRLQMIVGIKLEHNDSTGFEDQPSARLVWTPDENQTWWASVAKAVQVPSIGSQDATIIAAVPFPGTPVTVSGDRDLDATRLIAYEAGVRVKPRKDLAVSASLFFNDYENIIVAESTGPTTMMQTNGGAAESYGAEVALNWEAADNWRLMATYSYLYQNNSDGLSNALENNNPSNQFSLRSYLDLSPTVSLNSALYYTESINVGGTHIPSHIRFDTGIVWKVNSEFELGVWGQNLFDPSHPEFAGDGFVSNGYTEIERSVFIKATWRF